MIDASAAAQRFSEFQRKMYEWDLRFHPLMSEDAAAYAGEAKSTLKHIFDEYVYKYKEDYGRMSGPDTTYPPDYDPESDIVERVEVSRKKVTIYIKKTTRTEDRFRFIMAEHGGRWMIERAEIYWDNEERWGVYHL